MKELGCVLVSWDFRKGHSIVIVGDRDTNRRKTNVVNAFQGEEAKTIIRKLLGGKEENDRNS